MRNGERGFALVLVLVLLAVGALTIGPSLRLASTSLTAKQIHTDILEDQYARDGAAEYGIWLLEYGGLTSVLNEDNDEESFIVVLNGIETIVTVTLRTELGVGSVAGAEGDTIRPTVTVECDEYDDGVFESDCLATEEPSLLTKNNVSMVARYTVALEQLSPDTSVGLVAIYDELPGGFTFRPGSVESSSFTEILGISPQNIGSSVEQIWKWDFSSDPVYFTQGEVKTFTFEALINKSANRYCNDVFLKRESPPHQQAGKGAHVVVDTNPPDGCAGGGVHLEKFVDELVALPNQTTVFTYIINLTNLAGFTEQVENIKDVLPQGGFEFCNSASDCDDPLYKVVGTPFDPETGDFTDTTGFSTLDDPVETYLAANDRWELLWAFSPALSLAQAGTTDTLVVRFQAVVTPVSSGSYYNEVFADVNCSAPGPLTDPPEEVTTSQDYCASYSWPTGGTLVPMYDVGAEADLTSGQGNVTVGVGDTTLESWNVDDL